jgi:hypothetical protein
MCQTWAIAQVIIATLLLVVKQCILNQSHIFWLLLNTRVFAFNLCISMN